MLSVDRGRLRQALIGGLVFGATVGAVVVGRLALQARATPPRGDRPAAATAEGSGPGAIVPPADGPGSQIVVGRLVDRGSGLAVRDAGVSILELGRRSISLPDGRFRFDGVEPGAYTLVLGPAEGYVPRSLDIKVRPAGADVGIIGLVPAGPPTLVSAADGGALAACGGMRLQLPQGALPEDQAVSLTCLTGLDELPVPPPAGRLPLAAIDLGPGATGLIVAGKVEIALPSQPRYSAGVSLDLLRLDLDRLIWRPAGSLTVSGDGRSAVGEILAFGDYLATAPPFGAFGGAGMGSGPSLLRLNTSVAADGSPVEQVPPRTLVVYLDLAYRGLEDSPLRVRTADEAGELVFESTARLSGDGSRRVAMTAADGAWPLGDYVTSVYLGEPPQIQSLSWHVAEAAASPTMPAAWVSSASGDEGAADYAAQPPAEPAARGCAPPAAWWAYTVQGGDTLGALAMRTGSTIAALQSGNCLAGDGIRAGQLLYVPTIVYRSKPPLVVPAWPKEGGQPPSGSGPWPAPGAERPPVAWPTEPYLKATRPPDPTLAPRPTVPPQLWSAPPPLPTAPPQQQPLWEPPAPPPPAPAAPIQGSSGWKEPRGPDPTLAPRPGLP